MLREADFQGAALGSVRFDGCELRSATFAGARCAATELHRCELDGIEGVEGLRGAALPWPDLVGLAGPDGGRARDPGARRGGRG